MINIDLQNKNNIKFVNENTMTTIYNGFYKLK